VAATVAIDPSSPSPPFDADRLSEDLAEATSRALAAALLKSAAQAAASEEQDLAARTDRAKKKEVRGREIRELER
jgi:hypothetical protein